MTEFALSRLGVVRPRAEPKVKRHHGRITLPRSLRGGIVTPYTEYLRGATMTTGDAGQSYSDLPGFEREICLRMLPRPTVFRRTVAALPRSDGI